MPLWNDIHLNPPQLLKSYPLLPLQTASPGIIARTSTVAKSGYFAKIILQLRIFPWICMHITKPLHSPSKPFQQFFLQCFNLCANQLSQTLQDLWMRTSVTFEVLNCLKCQHLHRGFASSFDINHIMFSFCNHTIRQWIKLIVGNDWEVVQSGFYSVDAPSRCHPPSAPFLWSAPLIGREKGWKCAASKKDQKYGEGRSEERLQSKGEG